MKTFSEFIAESKDNDDLGKLQVAYNKYKFNLDMGNEAEAQKFLKTVKKLRKKVLAKDPEARNSAGKRWVDLVEDGVGTEEVEDNIFEALDVEKAHKGIKTDWQKKWVEEILSGKDTIAMAKDMGIDLENTDDAKRVITNILTSIKTKTIKGVKTHTLNLKIGGTKYNFKYEDI